MLLCSLRNIFSSLLRFVNSSFSECKLNNLIAQMLTRECLMCSGEPSRMKVIEVSIKDSSQIFSKLYQQQA